MNKKLYLIFLGVLILLGLLLSSPVKAAGGDGVCEGPIVPCGREGQSPCQLCHLFYLFENIVDFVLLCLIPPIAVLMIVIGGIMFFFAGASEKQLTRAKSILTTVAIGLVLIYGSYVIVSTFLNMVGVADTDFGNSIQNWYQLDIDCPGMETADPFDAEAVIEDLDQAIEEGAAEEVEVDIELNQDGTIFEF